MIPVLSRLDEIHRVTVTLRGCMSIVKMGRSSRQCESNFALPYFRQSVEPAHKDRFPIARMIGWSGCDAIKTPGPTPNVVRRIRVIDPTELSLTNLIEFLRQKLSIALMGARVR